MSHLSARVAGNPRADLRSRGARRAFSYHASMERQPMRMRGVVFDGPAQPTRIEELALDPPGEGEVLVRMAAAGVCHSDLHVVDGEWERPTGIVLGHEGSAYVEDVGPGVDNVRPGDLVVLSWTAPCGRCAACARGQPWLCSEPAGSGHRMREADVRLRRPNGSAVGVYSGIGTFGTRQVVAASAAVPVDPRTPPEIAALIGCAVTTGVGAVRATAGVQPGESVAVIGLGGVGLSAVMAAVDVGARPVVAIDTSEEKLELAARAGAHRALTPEAATEAAGTDHVLECIGLVTTIELAVELVRPGGTVTLVGMTPQGDRASFDVYRFVDDGKRILGSNYGSAVPERDFARIASEYVNGRLPLDLLVTERIGLEDLDRAFVAMREGRGARRVIVP
jgi:S-(hydroxymethyl)glutathione dehydrogenase/alcohol dehydrogenase